MAKEWIVPDADLGCDGAYFDYQELVRCKDCKHTKADGCGAIYCKKWDRWEMPEDYFCADGERR